MEKFTLEQLNTLYADRHYEVIGIPVHDVTELCGQTEGGGKIALNHAIVDTTQNDKIVTVIGGGAGRLHAEMLCRQLNTFSGNTYGSHEKVGLLRRTVQEGLKVIIASITDAELIKTKIEALLSDNNQTTIPAPTMEYFRDMLQVFDKVMETVNRVLTTGEEHDIVIAAAEMTNLRNKWFDMISHEIEDLV